MVQALHIDGGILFLASLFVAMVGQGYHCWRFRVPLFVLAFCLFSLALLHLGAYRPTTNAMWIYLRIGADLSTFALACMYYRDRRHPFTAH